MSNDSFMSSNLQIYFTEILIQRELCDITIPGLYSQLWNVEYYTTYLEEFSFYLYWFYIVKIDFYDMSLW